MHAISAIVLIVQLLAHSLAGCAWHHDHDQPPPDTTLSVPEAEPGASRCCQHHASNREPSADPAEEEPSSPDPRCCDESRCVLGVAPNRVDMDALHPVAFALVRADAWPLLASDTATRDREASIANAIEPPVRLHALHRVLLI